MEILTAEIKDIPELYSLQLLAFESEAEMIGCRDVPALMETAEHYKNDFSNWITMKIVNESNSIIAAIRYREDNGIINIGRLMVHPDYRQRGIAQTLMSEIDKKYPYKTKELYTCTKSWINIRLYTKMGYVSVKEVTENSGLSFVYMQK